MSLSIPTETLTSSSFPVPTTLATVTSSPDFFSALYNSNFLSTPNDNDYYSSGNPDINGVYLKGGHAGGGHAGGGGHVGSGGKGGGSGGKGGGAGSNGRAGHYYYNGRNYYYGYPVRYSGNRYYPGGVILPVAFGGGAGYLMYGHIYHTYTSDDTLYYSEVATCQASGSDASTIYSSGTAIETCLPAGSSISFKNDGGLVTINQTLSSGSDYYTTLSDSTVPSSSDTNTNSASSSTATANVASSAFYTHQSSNHQKLIALFTIIITAATLTTLL